MHAWSTSMLLLLHSTFMLSVVKMLPKGEVGGLALNSHGNYIVDHGKSWKNHGIVTLNFCGNMLKFYFLVLQFLLPHSSSLPNAVCREISQAHGSPRVYSTGRTLGSTRRTSTTTHQSMSLCTRKLTIPVSSRREPDTS